MVSTFHLLLRYFQIYYPNDGYVEKFAWCSHLGTVGVLMFLTISVWFMSTDGQPRAGNCVKKTIRQFRRLYPEYMISIIIIYLCSCFLDLGARTVLLKDFFINLTMLEGFLPGVPYVDGAHWYLTMLLAVTFWITVLSALPKEKHELGCCVLLAVCALLLKLPYGVLLSPFFATSYIADAIIVLEIKRMLCAHQAHQRCWPQSACILLATGYVFCIHGMAHVLYLYGSVFLLLCCLKNRLTFLCGKVLGFVAGISYPYYLVHQNLSYMIMNEVYARTEISIAQGHIIIALLVIVGLIPVAVLIQRIASMWVRR